jgi:alkylation response protein AidB-like acyl-CoA dehydrogenase
MPTATRQRGATFLLDPAPIGHVFTPERFTDEHRMIARTAEEFLQREVVPQHEALEHDPQANVPLLKRAGELGLLAIDIDEAHGGLGLDKVSSTLVSEVMGLCASFSVSHSAHVCIGTLPLLYFGTEAQKARYLPRLASGEIIAAYALTEPGAGSDALAGRTTATLSPDGAEWILTGTKMWISNAGFADLFTVFAKIDGEHFSAFLVERTAPGLSFGNEERKMGIKGSSTRAVNLEQVRIPVDHLLGARGQGGKIALNVLNVGRYKLGAGGIGGAKVALAAAAAYARERRQFGKPIAAFGAIRQKLAQMATRIWAGDAMVYRTVGNIDRALEGVAGSEAILKVLEEYAIESSILKVVGSESLCFVADEAVQIFGGNGFSAEYPVERIYRDARINRIFEGTNEINRLLVPTMLLKRASREELGVTGAAAALRAAAPFTAPDDAGVLAGLKRCARAGLDLARARYADTLAQEQEVVMALSDVIIDVYTAESALARAAQAAGDGADPAAAADLAQATLHDAASRIEQRAATLMGTLAGDAAEADALVAGVRAACARPVVDRVAIDRRIATRVLA